MKKKLFEGIKVADFTTAIAGPLATRFLAAQGAEVIKVESHGHPDSVRSVGPNKDMIPGIDRSTQFAFYNYSKKSISIDLGKAGGRHNHEPYKDEIDGAHQAPAGHQGETRSPETKKS